MKTNSLDKRCRKTRMAIKSCLMELMCEKDISKVTITEVALKADINRATFYMHYKDVYHVLDEIENDLIEKLFHIMDAADIVKSLHDPYPLFRELTNEINKDFEFYKLLVQSKNYSNLLNKVHSRFKERFLELSSGAVNIDMETLSFIVDFISSGITSVYKEWFYSNRNITLEQLSLSLSKLIGNGLNAVLDNQ